jgi:calcineurin-like phosphoesterase family protein
LSANVWFTSDLHLGHARIIELCRRPFADLDEMNEAIIRRWNERVASGDRVFVLGDVALGQIAESLPLVGRLNGTKLLVPGNHDRCWSGNHRIRPIDRSRYEGVGFTILPELHRHGDWWLCHFPTAGDSHDEDRYVNHRPTIPEGEWLVHGHVHEKWKVNGRQINVGVDVWDFRPVHEDEVRAIAVR